MAYIKAITYYQPQTIVTNEELINTLHLEANPQVVKTMGVDSRAWAAEDETSGDLAVYAAQKLFAEYGISPKDIDFLIFCSQGMDHFMPSTSCLIQDRLGIPTTAGAFGFDLGCSGFVYGLAMANSFVESGLATNVLLLTGDTTHKYIHPQDKNQFLFGDAASATLISNNGIASIGKFELGTDGKGADTIIIKNGSWRNKSLTGNTWTDENSNIHRDDWFYMDGEKVFNFTIDCIPPLMSGCLSKNGLDKEAIDYYVFHQANKFMLNTLRKLNGIPKEKFFVDISDTGNTASSTVPIGIVKSIKNRDITSGKTVLIAGFGVGLSWAGTVLYFK